MRTSLRLFLADSEVEERSRFRDAARALGCFDVLADVASSRGLAHAARDGHPDAMVVNASLLTPETGLLGHDLTRVQLPALIVLAGEPLDAMRAFGAGAVDCVLRPVDRDRCQAALSRANAHVLRARAMNAVGDLVRALRSDEAYQAQASPECEWRLRLAKGRHSVVVDSAQIEWIQAQDCYCQVHVDDTTYLTRRTLALFERRLDPTRFIRPHRVAMVNVASVTGVDTEKDGRRVLVLRSGARIPVSQRRSAHVAARMGERWIPKPS